MVSFRDKILELLDRSFGIKTGEVSCMKEYILPWALIIGLIIGMILLVMIVRRR